MAKKDLLKRLVPVVLLAASVLIGVTGATVLHDLTMENPIKTPPVEGGITENLEDGAKQVSFTNDGEADVFLRVAFSETWTIEEDGKSIILPNQTVDVGGKTVTVAQPNWLTENWDTSQGDGWYYYKKVLPGSRNAEEDIQKNTGLLVDGVTMADLTKLRDDRYKRADYQIHFVVEVVQASDELQVSKDAVKELFQKQIEVDEQGWVDDKYSATITWK